MVKFDDVKISKFLSLVLRHKPKAAGIKLNEGGWVSVVDLVHSLNNHFPGFKRSDLDRIVAECDKQRYIYDNNLDRSHQMIRANQGHSIAVDLNLKALIPPHTLFHGTATRFVDAIYLKGLIPGNRQYVHLSADVETATKVGERHGKVYIFRVNAVDMHNSGIKFYQSENGVWLTDHVPVKYLSPF